jgi:hypothetical protein
MRQFILKALLAVALRHTIVEESSEVLADNELHSTSAVKACIVAPGAVEGEVAIVELSLDAFLELSNYLEVADDHDLYAFIDFLVALI